MAVIVLLCLCAAMALLVAAAVAGLAPWIGLPWALAALSAVLLLVALAGALAIRAAAQRLKARRKAVVGGAGLVKVALALLPSRSVRRLEVAAVAGVAVGLAVLRYLPGKRQS